MVLHLIGRNLVKIETGIYISIDNIKNRNRHIYYWIMGDLLEPMASDFGPISSMIIKYKVNCEAEKQTWLSVLSTVGQWVRKNRR